MFVGGFGAALHNFYTVRSATCKRLCAVAVSDRRTVPEKALLRGAPKMLLEPLHQCGIGALEIGGSSALEPGLRAFLSNDLLFK